MNVVKVERINTNNGWGFGGKIATLTEYDNGLIECRGRNYHRHTGTSSANQDYIRIEEDFIIPIYGTKSSQIKIFVNKEHYYATYKNIDSWEQYNEIYQLFKVVKL